MHSKARGIILIILFIITQISFGQFRYGPQQGINISNLNYWEKKSGSHMNAFIKPKAGINMGLFLEEGFTKHIGITSGLFLSNVGYIDELKYNYYDNPRHAKSITHSYYNLMMPVNFTLSIYINKFRIICCAGPSFGMRLATITKTEHLATSGISPDNNYSRACYFTYIFGAGLGIEYNNIMIKTSCEAIETYNQGSRLINYNTTLAYLFGTKKYN